MSNTSKEAGVTGRPWRTRRCWLSLQGSKGFHLATFQTRLKRDDPIAHCASAYSFPGPHRVHIGTCRSSCSRSGVLPESDRCGRGCCTIRAYRQGRTCPRTDHGKWSGRKLATTLAGRRRRAVAVSPLLDPWRIAHPPRFLKFIISPRPTELRRWQTAHQNCV